MESTPTQRLRVCIVAPSLDILGGQSVQAARLLSRLRQVPWMEVDLLPVNPRLPGVLRRLQRVKYIRTVVTECAYVTALLRRLKRYDLVHIFSASYLSFVLAPTPALLIAKLWRRKAVLNYHSGEAQDHLRRWPSAIFTMRLADEIVVQSDFLVDVFASAGLHARPIANDVELDRFRYRPRSVLRPVFLANRNFESNYDVACLLRAFGLVQRQIPEARLLLVGDGSQRAALEVLARELRLSRVEFIGRVAPTEMHRLYDAADVYLNSSVVDNMPLSILEAFSAGTPVVTTSAGGIPFLVRHEETGLLAEPGDHHALAAAALRLLEQPELARRMAARAHAECQARYGWDAVRDQWLNLYRSLSGRSSLPAERDNVPDGSRSTPEPMLCSQAPRS